MQNYLWSSLVWNTFRWPWSISSKRLIIFKGLLHSSGLILYWNCQYFWKYPDKLRISHKTKGLICFFKIIINGRFFLVLLCLIFYTTYLNINTRNFKLSLITVISYFAICDWEMSSWFREVTNFQFSYWVWLRDGRIQPVCSKWI